MHFMRAKSQSAHILEHPEEDLPRLRCQAVLWILRRLYVIRSFGKQCVLNLK